jgi:hypothetical protein
VLFSHESFTGTDLDRLRQDAFPAMAAAPAPTTLGVRGHR